MATPRSFHRGTALLVAVTFFMENLDGTIIQTAAPATARDLGVAAVDLNLAMVVYLMAVAILLPASGRLTERWGVRRVFLVAVLIFTLASIACAFAPSLPFLTVARAAQGLGGALMVPVGRLAVLTTTSTRDLLAAMAYLTWPGLLVPVIAPLLGGLLADTIGWQWIFLLNVPLGVAALVAVPFLLPRHEPTGPPRFDWLGFAVLALGLGLVTVGSEALSGPDAGGSGTAVAAPFGLPSWVTGLAVVAVGVLVCTLAARHMLRTASPLLRLGALRLPTFRVGNVSGSVYRLLISGAPFLMTLWLQVGLGHSAVQAGAYVLAVFVGNVAIKPATTPILRRLGFRTTLIVSAAAGAALIAALALVDASTPPWIIVAVLVASGVFRSVGFTAYNTVQFVDVDAAERSDANTLSSTLQQIATALGIALVALLVRVGQALVPGPGGYRVAFLLAAAVLLSPLVGALLLPRGAGSEATQRARLDT